MTKDLELVFKYYKAGKITEFTLCSELEEYLETNLRTQVIINSEAKGSASNSFIVALLPVRSENGYKVKYIIDKKVLDSQTITFKELICILDCLKNDEQKILAAFRHELKQIADVEMSLRDALIVYSKIYRMCLDAFPYDILQKAKRENVLDIDRIDETIEKLMGFDEKTEYIIETLVINNMLPVQFIEEAKKLVFDECGRKVVIGDSLTPDENILAYEMGNENKPVVDTAEIDITRIDK